ncbi:MAG: caspase family protein [Elusimicrobia bacterium]|nr:caspase family protein [Elusimicrobiota bacterium]
MISRAPLLLVLAFAAACATPVARYPVGPDVPEESFADARRELVSSLKHGILETFGFSYATLQWQGKFRVRDEGFDFDYMKYAGLLDSVGHAVTTNCDFATLDEPAVVEFDLKAGMSRLFKFAVPLGANCDRLAMYYPDRATADAFARTLFVMRRLSEEGRTGASGGISKEDLSTIVQAAVAGAQAPKPAAAAPVSDVDKPTARRPERAQDYAVVVGIEKYSDLPEARFAERDAEAVKDNLIALGFPSRNVVLLSGEKAGYKSLEKFVETWLPRNADPNGTVFFYFSGHGAPDVRTGQAYLVPWDGDAGFLENTGYPLKRLYEKLGALPAKRVLVALDACFSGAGGRSVLAKGARPLVTKTDSASPPPAKVTVLAAASGEQITSVLDEQGHGTFTYYLLKGLPDAASAAGLLESLKPKVADAARRQNRDQTPVLLGADTPLF